MRHSAALALASAIVVTAASAVAQDGGVADASPPDGASPQAPVAVPPALVTAPDFPYPTWADGLPIEVDLLVTVGRDGHVLAIELAPHRADDPRPPPDARAVDEVLARARDALFHPATVDGAPVPARAGWHVILAPDVAGVIESTPPAVTHDSAMAAPDAGAPAASPTPHAGTDAGPDDVPTFGASAHAEHQRAPDQRAPSDFFTPIGGLRHVPRTNAGHLLDAAAPGILLTNEGGEGHAEQVYLRGFDAHEGQDLEFTVDGVPINEPGNPHGEGYADTHFIIPELVRSVRVIEGPFDPHQGNYAVAGSAEYSLGLEHPDLLVSYGYGSFNTHRFLSLFRPEGSEPGTFAGVELRTTDGYGQNRYAQRATAMGGYELRLSPTLTVRLLATAYATKYGEAGVVREDDYDAGRIGFFGTYDPSQGGDNSRYLTSATLEERNDGFIGRLQLFAGRRDLRIRENFTGFVEDPPERYRTGIAQRGDEVDQAFGATTIGSRGSLRTHAEWEGRTQSIEVGYYARWDGADSAQRRLRFGTTTPYRVDFDLGDSLTNLAAYVDAELRPLPYVVVRGGLRGDYFGYDVLDRCALHDTTLSSSVPVVDTLCYSVDRTGPRDPTERRSASGLAVQPRATLLLGPVEGFSLAGSFGMGARAADPTYLGDGNKAPFASITATEAGVLFQRAFGDWLLNARALYYFTYVSHDLLFDQQAGRATLAPSTERQGALIAARLIGPWLDTNFSLTYANARFGSDRGTPETGVATLPPDYGDRVPYVPEWVLRSETGVYGVLPWLIIDGHKLLGRAALGISYVSARPLPYQESGDPIFLLDASVGVRYRGVELGIAAQNLLDFRYRLAEFNYVSSFTPGTTLPDEVAARHFVAGPPLSIFATLTLHFGPDAWEVGS